MAGPGLSVGRTPRKLIHRRRFLQTEVATEASAVLAVVLAAAVASGAETAASELAGERGPVGLPMRAGTAVALEIRALQTQIRERGGPPGVVSATLGHEHGEALVVAVEKLGASPHLARTLGHGRGVEERPEVKPCSARTAFHPKDTTPRAHVDSRLRVGQGIAEGREVRVVVSDKGKHIALAVV